jgi:hypothetical protein
MCPRGQEPQSCEWPVDMLDVLNFPFTARNGTTRARARTMVKSFSASKNLNIGS